MSKNVGVLCKLRQVLPEKHLLFSHIFIIVILLGQVLAQLS